MEYMHLKTYNFSMIVKRICGGIVMRDETRNGISRRKGFLITNGILWRVDLVMSVQT